MLITFSWFVYCDRETPIHKAVLQKPNAYKRVNSLLVHPSFLQKMNSLTGFLRFFETYLSGCFENIGEKY